MHEDTHPLAALMSDGENADGDATAWFSCLTFSADATPPTCPSP
jgi:hypothetical protein